MANLFDTPTIKKNGNLFDTTPIRSSGSSKLDLGTSGGLYQTAVNAGLETQANKIVDTTPKLSVLERLGAGLGALNPAEAILTGRTVPIGEGRFQKFAGTYAKNVVQGVGSAITGKDYQGERRYFKDLTEEMGIENRIAKFGLGFVGDVLLDPSTYFGGAIAKGLTKVVGKTTSVGLKGIGKVAPETEAGLRMAGTGLQDAFGRAFEYGYKTSKGATADIMTFLSKEQRAKLGIASSNLNRLGTGVLTKEQSEELALKMMAGRRAEKVALDVGKSSDEAGQIAIEATKSTDPLVQETITKQMERGKSFAKTAGVENPYEVYFPGLKKDKLTKFVKDPEVDAIRLGSEGYKKEWKDLITNDELMTNPAEAFFTRESQIVSDKMTREFLTGFVKKYGKGLDTFKNSDEALQQGFHIIKEKGFMGKELGYVGEFDAKLIRDSIDKGFQTVNMLAKATGFDAVTSLFKRSVTGLFAPFHVRNYLSGHIQNYEALGVQALSPKNINIGQKIAYNMGKGIKFGDDVVELGGKKMKFAKIMKPFEDRFSGDTFYNNDFNVALKNGNELKQVAKTFSKQSLKETVKTVGLGQDAIHFKIGRAIGQFIEHNQKATAYVTALGQGKSITDALKLAEVAGFDYRALTSFESQIMRRVIPFYSFTRKNIGLQLKTLGENPQRINQVMAFFTNMGDRASVEEKKNLPDYIKQSLGIKLEDTPEGLSQYIASFGTPIEALTSLFDGNPILRALSMTNPIIKAPVEIGIGKDSFRQRDLKDVYNASEYKMAPQFVKDMLEIKEVKKPIYKTVNGESKIVGEKSAYIADPVKLLIARSLFTSRGVSYLDQVFGNDMKGFVKVLKTTTGIKPTQVDIEAQKYFTEKDKQRALEDLLTRYGVTKQFTKTYIPKNNLDN